MTMLLAAVGHENRCSSTRTQLNGM